MNSLPPSYAFASTNASDDCGGTPSQRTFGGVTGNIGESCTSLKQRVLGNVIPQNTKLGPPSPPKTGRKKQVHTPATPNSLGTGSVGDASPSVVNTVQDSLSSISNTISSVTGLPPDFNGIPLSVILVGAGAILIILFTMM